MASRGDRPQTARSATNRSLKAERSKTDRELVKQRVRTEGDADTVIALARGRADAVLAHAREREDKTMKGRAEVSNRGRVQVRKRVTSEREAADAVLAAERDTEDKVRIVERIERRAAFEELFGRERALTDQRLTRERIGADALLASRDAFLAMVSHEVGTLVGAVALSSASLTKVSSEPKVQRAIAAHVDRIEGAMAVLTRLTRDLIDVAAIDAGRFTLTRTPEDAASLARLTSDLFEEEAAAKGIAVRTDLPSGTVLLPCDRGRILQVLANLVRNAIQATPKRGVIGIRVAVQPRRVRFVVTDTGVGMSRRDAMHAFDRGWRAPGREGGGLGLGLYVAQSIVEAHRGTIRLTRRRSGGTSVAFTVPIDDRAPRDARSRTRSGAGRTRAATRQPARA